MLHGLLTVVWWNPRSYSKKKKYIITCGPTCCFYEPRTLLPNRLHVGNTWLSLGKKEMEFWEAGSWVDLTHTLHTRGQKNHYSPEGPSQDKGTEEPASFLCVHLSLPSTATRTSPFLYHITPFSSPSHTARLIENIIIPHLSIVSFPQEVYLPHPTSSLACHTLVLRAVASSLQSDCDMPCSELFNGSR